MPTLFEFGEGVLKTHVTWEDLQEDCLEIFGETAVFGANKAATSIGDGRGFMSKMCLITPDWEDSTLPKTLVVKICSQLAMVEANEKMKGKNPEMDAMMENMAEKMMEAIAESTRKIHATEVTVYDLFKKYDVKGIPHPKVYKSVRFTEDTPHKGYLIMEHVDGAENLNIYNNISPEDIKQALSALAAMEAASLSFSDEEKASLPCSNFKQLFAQMLTPDTMKATQMMMRQFFGNVLSTKLDKLDEYINDILNLDVFDMDTVLGMEKVLVHGDAWTTNLLWRKSSDGSHKLAAIVDYQTAHFGIPAADFLRVLAANLSGKDRQTHWEELAEFFHEELVKNIGSVKPPYDLKQLKENIRRFYPMAGILLVPMMGPIMQMNHMNPDEEEKKKVTELVQEKMECLLDDMFLYHERNLQLKKDEEEQKNGKC